MLNMAAIHAQAFRKKGLKFLMAMHHAYHFTGYYQYVPTQTDPSLQLLYGQQGTTVENQLWLAKLKEIVDEFQPDIVWQDFNLSQVQEPMRLQFLAVLLQRRAVAGRRRSSRPTRTGSTTRAKCTTTSAAAPATSPTRTGSPTTPSARAAGATRPACGYYTAAAGCSHLHRSRQQERQPPAEHLADAGRHDPAAAEGHPERVRDRS